MNKEAFSQVSVCAVLLNYSFISLQNTIIQWRRKWLIEATPTYTYNPFTSWIVFMLYRTYVLLSAHRAYVLFTLSFPIEI